jgi:hypothetical protein
MLERRHPGITSQLFSRIEIFELVSRDEQFTSRYRADTGYGSELAEQLVQVLIRINQVLKLFFNGFQVLLQSFQRAAGMFRK